MSDMSKKKIILVLSGGGMRGMAHIGVINVIESLGINISEYVGASIGSLIGAMAAVGLKSQEIEEIARRFGKQDILDLDYWGFLWKRGRIRSAYKGKKLHDFIKKTLPIDSFDELPKPFFANAADINTGANVFWGLEKLKDLPIHDAVYSSCAIPGIFPPKKIGEAYYVDGGVVDPLPIKFVKLRKPDIIIAVNLCHSLPKTDNNILEQGLAALIAKANAIQCSTIIDLNLHDCLEYPLILINIDASRVGVLDFDDSHDLVEMGRQEGLKVLKEHPLLTHKKYRFFSRSSRKPQVNITLDTANCLGCGSCHVNCPTQNFLLKEGKSKLVSPNNPDCILDMACLKHCPARCISFALE
jgi:NTE family protein